VRFGVASFEASGHFWQMALISISIKSMLFSLNSFVIFAARRWVEPLRNPPLSQLPRWVSLPSSCRASVDERGQDVAAVLAEAVALLDSVVDIAGPDVGEDRRRLDAFIQTRAAVPLGDVKAWVASWGSPNELPRPAPRKIG
jgi:hypothetical protein